METSREDGGTYGEVGHRGIEFNVKKNMERWGVNNQTLGIL